MNRFLYLTAVSVFFINCASPSNNSAVINSGNSATTNNSQVLTANQVNENSETQANVNPAQDIPAFRDRQDFLKNKKGANSNAAPINAKILSNPAPDNSEIVSTMNTKGTPIETRSFKNNPTLVKVEKIFTDIKNPQIKVYLKNGKVISVSLDKLPNMETTSANDILIAAGVSSPTSTQRNQTGAKQKEQ